MRCPEASRTLRSCLSIDARRAERFCSKRSFHSSTHCFALVRKLLNGRSRAQKEIKHIMKKRTAFETALVRRVAKKGDFLRYAAYEMSLDSLRKKRLERLSE